MDCFGTYFTHIQTCNVTRVPSATEWTASVHTLPSATQWTASVHTLQFQVIREFRSLVPRGVWQRKMCLMCSQGLQLEPANLRSWIAGMKLMLDLLLGARKHRYLGRCLVDPRPAQVYVRGFSAGSYSGICLLHLLWNMPVQVGGILGGISCPPPLLHGILPEHGDRLMLIHLTRDRLCQWHPYDETLSSLNCKYCIVDRSTQELREHFGTCEHSYGHWIDLSLPHGRYPLYQLLRQYPDVAPANGAVWRSGPCFFRWGPRDWGPTTRSDFQWGDFLGHGQRCADSVTFGGKFAASWLHSYNAFHSLVWCTSWIWSYRKWCRCSPRRRRFASSYRIAERTAWGEWDVEYTLNATKLFQGRALCT